MTSGGLWASYLSADTKANAGQNASSNHLSPNVLYMMLPVVFMQFLILSFLLNQSKENPHCLKIALFQQDKAQFLS